MHTTFQWGKLWLLEAIDVNGTMTLIVGLTEKV